MEGLNTLIQLIVEPLGYAFIVRGLAAGVLAGLSCAILSSFVVWRGMAFMGDAIAHSILPGIVAAYALGISLIYGALIAALIAVFGIGWISRRSGLREDTAIGIVFAGFFALGILMLSRISSYRDLSHILFGNILGVTSGDLIAMSVVVILVVATVAATFKELLVSSFDPSHAVAIGLSPHAMRYLLLILIALTTVVALQSVGVVLVLALLVTPAAAASQLSSRLGVIMVFSVVFAVASTVVGFYLSYYADVPSGSAIVVTLIGIFIITLGIKQLVRRRA